MKKFRNGFLALVIFALAAETAFAQPGNLSSWKILAEGGAQVEIAPVAVTLPALDDQNTNALQITVKQTGERFGIVCPAWGKRNCSPASGMTFRLMPTDPRKTYALIFSLESQNGKTVGARTTLPEVGQSNWTHYTVALHIRLPVSKCRMVIALADTGSISLNDISVVLRKTTAKN